MYSDDLFDMMAKAIQSIPKDAKMVMKLNPTAEAWALEMERQGLLKRREDGMFHMDDMFELYMRQKNGQA